MLVVTVTLVPGGYGPPEELGRMIIANDGTGDQITGNYVVRLGRKGQTDNRKIYAKPQRQGEVKGHRRLALSVWNLVGKCLHAIGHGKEIVDDEVEQVIVRPKTLGQLHTKCPQCDTGLHPDDTMCVVCKFPHTTLDRTK